MRRWAFLGGSGGDDDEQFGLGYERIGFLVQMRREGGGLAACWRR